MAKPRPFNGRVIFDHRPKTGGLAIRAWLVRALGTASISPHVAGEHRALIRRYGGEYPVIAAHLQFVGEGFDPRYQYLTCVREPVDRAISWLFMVRNDARDPFPLRSLVDRFIITEGEDLHDDLLVHIENNFTKHFASIASETPGHNPHEPAIALSAVEKYDVWGLFEDFHIFVADVASFIGLPAPDDIDRVNVTPNRPTLETVSPRLRKRLEQLNALDIELYDVLRGRRESRGARKREAADTSPWLPYTAGRSDRAYSAPEFTLIAARREGNGAVSRGQSLSFLVEFSLSETIPDLEIGIHILDEDGRCAFGTNTTLLKQPLLQIGPGTHRMEHRVVAELPEGKYTAGFAFAERHEEGSRELAWYDKLVEFSVAVPRPQACVGYASLPVVVNYRQIGETVVGLVENAAGSLQGDRRLSSVGIGDEFFLPVRIENASSQSWVSTHRNPLTLSYHWLDQDGNVVLFDGERTPFPATELAPNHSVSALMRVVAPSSPGKYRLLLTPVQERHRWFNECGSFVPEILDLLVVDQSDHAPS